MGSEVSAEVETQIYESRNVLKRSNSVEEIDIKTLKPRKQVQRSQTFSSLGSGPRIKPKTFADVKKELDTSDALRESGLVNVSHSSNLRETAANETDKNDDNLFIPSKISSLNRIHQNIHEPTEFSSKPKSNHIDEKIRFDSSISSTKVPLFQLLSKANAEPVETNSVSGSVFGVGRGLPISQNIQSTDESNRKYSDSSDHVENITSDSESSEELKKKAGTINRRSKTERKKVKRSKSWSVNVAIDRYSIILEDEQLDSNTASMPDNLKFSPAASPNETPRTARRTSDPCLLREQHVKRSEQFSAIIKQINDNKPKTKELSTYGLGVITGNRTKQQQSNLRLKSQRQYFDNWVREQGQRINLLSQTLKGDDDEVRNTGELSCDREKKLYSVQQESSPPQAKARSASLPRRRKSSKITNYLSSSDSEDNLIKRTSSTGSKTSFDDQQRLKKQLSDTILLVDNSFRNNNAAIISERACTPSPKLLARRRLDSPTALKLLNDFKEIDDDNG